ncbi:D-hexose-6-phosphate mutarotase [Hydrogenophaga sp. RWCD_12]|uniref:D-hexose-6-phosphate mutarotase n=1 Tax=Hydrogenophaga sp. RWCD_12 TaxID=3391190 RepID=UPI0039849446
MTAPGADPVHQRVRLQGLDCHALHLPGGDRVLVAEHGGQVLSWVAQGRERLYLSPTAVLDGHAAIRGGIPVCWPQFSLRGSLPRHGWVRQARWSFIAADLQAQSPRLVLELRPAELLPADAGPWAHDCRLEVTVAPTPGRLEVTLAVFNMGQQPLPFTGALHTYLALSDAETATVTGWPDPSSRQGWDSMTDTPCRVEPGLSLRGEIDRILPAAPAALVMTDGNQELTIEQSGWADTVVWNPGADKCAAMSDMPNGDERRMACIEAAQALSPVSVPPRGVWAGTQRLSLVHPS